MANVEEMLKNSACFGLAFDAGVKECKICEVKLRCESKCRGGVVAEPRPESVALADKDEISQSDAAAQKSAAKEADKAAKKPKKAATKASDVAYADDMPDFKAMSLDDLNALLDERAGAGSSKEMEEKFPQVGIRRMRITMALKKTYAQQ